MCTCPSRADIGARIELIVSHLHAVHEPVGSPAFCAKIATSALLVLAGGVFAGCVAPFLAGTCSLWDRLTLGLMGLDELHLRVLATSSDDVVERKNAQKGASLISLPLLADPAQS